MRLGVDQIVAPVTDHTLLRAAAAIARYEARVKLGMVERDIPIRAEMLSPEPEYDVRRSPPDFTMR